MATGLSRATAAAASSALRSSAGRPRLVAAAGVVSSHNLGDDVLSGNSNHHYLQARQHRRWAPPAYRKPRENKNKKFKRPLNDRKSNTSFRASNSARHKGVRSSSRPHKKRHGGAFKKYDSRPLLMETHHDHHDDGSNKEEHKGDVDPKPSFFRARKLELMHQKMGELLSRYQTTLFRNNSDNSENGTDSDNGSDKTATEDTLIKTEDDVWGEIQQVQWKLQRLHNQHQDDANNDETSAASWKSIQETEQTYAEMCRLLQRLIVAWAKQPPPEQSEMVYNSDDEDEEDDVNRQCSVVDKDDEEDDADKPKPPSYDVAEQLLMELIQLQSDRSRLVTAAKKDIAEAQSKKQQSWTSWMKEVFLFSPGEESENDQQKVFAHEDALYGPSTRLFGEVMKSIWDGTPRSFITTVDDETFYQDFSSWRRRLYHSKGRSRKSDSRRAQRLTSLLSVMSQHGLKPESRIMSILIQSHAAVGRLENAIEAERILSEHGGGGHLFRAVLRAFRLASYLEGRPSLRAEAARRAEWLLKNRKPKRSEIKLMLQTLSNPGLEALPDMCERADHVMEQFMGKQEFQQLLEDPHHDPTVLSTELSVLHELVFLYMSSNDAKMVDRAKLLLRHMETRRQHIQQHSPRSDRSSKPTSSRNDNSLFPNVFTYNAVLSGLLRPLSDGSNKQSKTSHQAPRERVATALYGTELLDNMVLYPSSSPDRVTFRTLLNLWSRSKSSQGGERAEELLSRMEIHNACSGYSWWVDRLPYFWTLESWAGAAAAGQPGAAQRALRLLDKMEAQCSPIVPSEMEKASAVDDGDTLNPLSTFMYNDGLRPRLYEYEKVIQTCSLTTHPSDRDEALRIAFDVYNRTIEHGIRPRSGTYTLLLHCCARLLPDDKERRTELARHVFKSASDQDQVSKAVLRALRQVNDDLAIDHPRAIRQTSSRHVAMDDVSAENHPVSTETEVLPPTASNDLETFTIPVLRAMLQQRGLDVAGSKEDLIERLKAQ